MVVVWVGYKTPLVEVDKTLCELLCVVIKNIVWKGGMPIVFEICSLMNLNYDSIVQ
jgi:hypothetical protein